MPPQPPTARPPSPAAPAAPAPPAARRRTIRKAAPLIILLIAGATLNVAVAWGLAAGNVEWDRFVRVRWHHWFGVGQVATHGYGVPMIGVQFDYVRSVWGEDWITGGIDLSGRNPWRLLALPVVPAWPGFAINTLFYAGVLWVLCCAPFALRRMIRRRRGQCPACAYPIGQSPVCTECGAAVSNENKVVQ